MVPNRITADLLVRVISEDAYRGALKEVLENLRDPPGRQPRPRLVELSDWYEELPSRDKSLLEGVMREVAESAVFSVLCLLDNVRPVVDAFAEELALKVVSPEGERDLRAKGVELHGIFRALVDEELAGG